MKGPGKKGDGLENYNLLKVLGRGSYGKVLLAENKWHPDDIYAMKVLKKHSVMASVPAAPAGCLLLWAGGRAGEM